MNSGRAISGDLEPSVRRKGSGSGDEGDYYDRSGRDCGSGRILVANIHSIKGLVSWRNGRKGRYISIFVAAFKCFDAGDGMTSLSFNLGDAASNHVFGLGDAALDAALYISHGSAHYRAHDDKVSLSAMMVIFGIGNE